MLNSFLRLCKNSFIYRKNNILFLLHVYFVKISQHKYKQICFVIYSHITVTLFPTKIYKSHLEK